MNDVLTSIDWVWVALIVSMLVNVVLSWRVAGQVDLKKLVPLIEEIRKRDLFPLSTLDEAIADAIKRALENQD